jgi:signal transduction histidine kinase
LLMGNPMLTTKLLILMQIPLVSVLVVLALQNRKVDDKKEFKYICLGWIINAAYLAVSLSLIRFSSNKYDLPIGAIFDLASIYCFFLVSYRCSKLPLFVALRRLPRIFYFGIFVITAVFRIIPFLFPYIATVGRVNLWNLPTAILDTFSLYYVAVFYQNYTTGFQRTLLYWGSFLYAAIQVLILWDVPAAASSDFNSVLQMTGFSLGMLAKFLMVSGMIGLLLHLVENLTKKERDLFMKQAFADKLNEIIGRTFHEITPPLLEIETLTSVIKSKEGAHDPDVRIGKKTFLQIEKIEGAVNRLRSILTASIKMYHSDVLPFTSSGDIVIDLPIPVDDEIDILNINTIIEIAVMNFKSTLTRENLATDQIKFVLEYGGNCNITCNLVQMVQVFLNLFKNCYEASQNQESQCKVFVKTKNLTENQENARASRFICVEIEDNGPGISENVLPLIYDQGFSTKADPGRGRGFGMPIVKSYTELNGGRIEIESPPVNRFFNNGEGGQGTKFILKFPKSFTKIA